MSDNRIRLNMYQLYNLFGDDMDRVYVVEEDIQTSHTKMFEVMINVYGDYVDSNNFDYLFSIYQNATPKSPSSNRWKEVAEFIHEQQDGATKGQECSEISKEDEDELVAYYDKYMGSY